ncbi:MAG: ABC transporter substrate-binding protein [Firmicutes bacterium]|nr:ABC transporter substrate-binding protein [Bacillota bacterium]
MKTIRIRKPIALFLTAIMIISLLSGCSVKKDTGEEENTITVYMWSNALYNSYAPYIQSQLKDINIQFVVGNNDLDFYKFLKDNGSLPDIITCRRFSLHDAVDLKDHLMDLSTTNISGAVYDSYIDSFTNTDNTVNWLPLCGEVDGLVINRALFKQYNIPIPTDYESLIYACKAFDEVGIRGFVADFAYDYTCMEILQGLSIPEITSIQGCMWRSRYEDPMDSTIGLDNKIWPKVFENMEKFIEDANIQPGDLELDYTPVINLFIEGKAAIIRAEGNEVIDFQNKGIDAEFIPYFGQNGDQWLLTYPQFQVALNADLAKDEERLNKAKKILHTMLTEEAQNVLSQGEDVIAYSHDIDLEMSPSLENLKPYIDQNRLYIRIASNDFFAASKEVVSKMIKGEYNAQQAYKAFDEQLCQTKENNADIVLSLDKGYSNIFHKEGGNQSYSVMANTLRQHYGSDVLVASGDSFTGSVLKADYTQKMAADMVMPNALQTWKSNVTGAELKEIIRAYVEGTESGLTPFNRGSLPVTSGICMEVKESEGSYTLVKVIKDGREIQDDEIFSIACLNTEAHMSSLLETSNYSFEKENLGVKDEWKSYILNGGTIAEPESYITIE